MENLIENLKSKKIIIGFLLVLIIIFIIILVLKSSKNSKKIFSCSKDFDLLNDIVMTEEINFYKEKDSVRLNINSLAKIPNNIDKTIRKQIEDLVYFQMHNKIVLYFGDYSDDVFESVNVSENEINYVLDIVVNKDNSEIMQALFKYDFLNYDENEIKNNYMESGFKCSE